MCTQVWIRDGEKALWCQPGWSVRPFWFYINQDQKDYICGGVVIFTKAQVPLGKKTDGKLTLPDFINAFEIKEVNESVSDSKIFRMCNRMGSP